MKSTNLNLGCGDRFIKSWINLDFVAQLPWVNRHDLRQSISLCDSSLSFVYHSHVLEHLSPVAGGRLLAECYRILRPGGLLRVVVPDLEQKARRYIESVEEALNDGQESTLACHQWMIIEMIDQMVRTLPGGEMIRFMRSGRAAEFVSARIGDEYYKADRDTSASEERPVFGVRQRIRALIRKRAMEWLRIIPEDAAAARFRGLGELHLWMYDRVNLASSLQAAGFKDIAIRDAFNSAKPDWTVDGVYLDVEGGAARKPDSLYMEARHP